MSNITFGSLVFQVEHGAIIGQAQVPCCHDSDGGCSSTPLVYHSSPFLPAFEDEDAKPLSINIPEPAPIVPVSQAVVADTHPSPVLSHVSVEELGLALATDMFMPVTTPVNPASAASDSGYATSIPPLSPAVSASSESLSLSTPSAPEDAPAPMVVKKPRSWSQFFGLSKKPPTPVPSPEQHGSPGRGLSAIRFFWRARNLAMRPAVLDDTAETIAEAMLDAPLEDAVQFVSQVWGGDEKVVETANLPGYARSVAAEVKLRYPFIAVKRTVADYLAVQQAVVRMMEGHGLRKSHIAKYAPLVTAVVFAPSKEEVLAKRLLQTRAVHDQERKHQAETMDWWFQGFLPSGWGGRNAQFTRA